MTLGWKAIQSQAKDFQQGNYWRSQAIRHNPWLFLSKEHFRLSMAIAIMQWLGTDGYQQFLYILYGLRRRFKFSGN